MRVYAYNLPNDGYILFNMHCPDCGGTLVEVTLSGIDKSFRCFRCGGIWVKDNTLSELSLKALEDWKPLIIDGSILMAGVDRCPEDGFTLNKTKSEKMPESWNVRKCEKCQGWWWPTDTLFRVKELVIGNTGYTRVKEVVV